MSLGTTKNRLGSGLPRLVLLNLALLFFGTASRGQEPLVNNGTEGALAGPHEIGLSGGRPQPTQGQPGNISGEIVDQSGVNIAGAEVRLARQSGSSEVEAVSDEDGQFTFANVVPGPFRLTISSPGLSSQAFSGNLDSGQNYVTPVIILVVPALVTIVHVGLPPKELAGLQIEDQERQRAFGFVPNFYVSYWPHPAPLDSEQKFELAWKSASDPVTLIAIGALAGIGQAGDRWAAYGQGARGYAKRYGASYADVFAATFIGSAVLPSLLKQDPRYLYKDTGSKRSRLFYAIASSVICKGDDGKWQPNYSNVLGSFAAGGLEELYIPRRDREGSDFLISSALIRLGETSLAGIMQEFVLRKFTRDRGHR